MAGDGRHGGSDHFEVAARRDDVEDPSVLGLQLSTDIQLPKHRVWPQALRRYGAIAVAVALAIASAFVLGRSLRPAPEVARAQELAGRVPDRNTIAGIDLHPDWTHTRGLDVGGHHRRHSAQKRKHRPSRRSTIRYSGGGSRTSHPAGSTAVTDASAGGSVVRHHRKSHKGSGKDKGGKEQAAAEEPKLPEPTVPLYHLYKTFKKKKPNHFFTGDAATKDDKIESGWQFLATEGFMFDREYEGTVAVPADNGIPGYIYAKKEQGALPLYMLRGYNGYGDIFTSDAAYRDKMIEEGWNDFGVVGYIAQT